VVVENRAGASGTIGLGAIAKAPADGYTLGMMIVSNATHAAMQGGKSAIDLIKDFAPVTHVGSQPYLLLVNASLPARSVRDLIALARARPGDVTYGSSGVGSVLHLAGELLAAQTKVKLTHVPYKGAAPALSDVAGGHIAMLFTTRVTAKALLASGKVRALAVTSTERVAGIPDVPTVQESGVTGPFEVTGWYGLSTAAGVPAPIIERLSADINRVLKLPTCGNACRPTAPCRSAAHQLSSARCCATKFRSGSASSSRRHFTSRELRRWRSCLKSQTSPQEPPHEPSPRRTSHHRHDPQPGGARLRTDAWISGAEVIKLEEPKGGDIARAQNNDELFFLAFNANKRSLTLNLKSDEAKAHFRTIIAQSDVLIENFGPGALDRLGLGWKDLQKINPRLIFATIKGFGTYGPTRT